MWKILADWAINSLVVLGLIAINIKVLMYFSEAIESIDTTEELIALATMALLAMLDSIIVWLALRMFKDWKRMKKASS